MIRLPLKLIMISLLSFMVFGSVAQSIRTFQKSDSVVTDTTYLKEKKFNLPSAEFETGPTSYKMEFNARVQSRYDIIASENAETIYDPMFRRVRFKSDGHLFLKKLEYKFEIDFTEPISVLDAVLKYKINDNWSFWAGQTKLQGNRERVVSSQDLQFVDRSLLNAKFNIDRDLGIWLHHKKNYDDLIMRKSFSVSKGEGLILFKDTPFELDKGLAYTGRIEVLPFGEFEQEGDYFLADLAYEETIKLAFGASYSYNNNAINSRGQLGEVTNYYADLKSIFVDAILKYRGFTYLGEYANRKAGDFTLLIPDADPAAEEFYTGFAFNNQVGYIFWRNFEFALRHTILRPESISGNNNINEYTVALSKYIIGHEIKVQTDLSLRQEDGQEDLKIFRIQLELSI